MKPRLLKIKGLNSFIEEQVIDFSKLTEYGLFGIFGPTGSGKSTILDAIILALYGRIPRSGGKPSGFINTNVDDASVYYEFEIGAPPERRVYFVHRILQKKNDNGVNTKEAKICDITDPENPQVLCEGVTAVNSAVEKIIGLGADDFTRSVVLPQGSFSEFLRLTGKERRDMLERIFGLEKYGEELMERARRFKRIKDEEYNVLEGRLSSYEGISEESYAQLCDEIKKLLKIKSEIQKEYEKIEKEYDRYKSMWELQRELEVYKKKEAELEAQKGHFEEKRKMLEMAKKAEGIKPYIDRLQKREEELGQKTKELDDLKRLLSRVAAKLFRTESQWKMAMEQKDKKLPGLITKREELKRAVKIAEEIENLRFEVKGLEDECNMLNGQIREKEQGNRQIQLRLEEGKKDLESINARIDKASISPGYREKLEQAYQQEREYSKLLADRKRLEERINSLVKVIDENLQNIREIVRLREEAEKTLEVLKNKKNELDAKCPGGSEVLLDAQKRLNTLEAEIKEVRELEKNAGDFKKELANLQDKRRILERGLEEKKRLLKEKENECEELEKCLQKMEREHLAGILARDLQDGFPCPVCGSTRHPRLACGYEIGEIEEKKADLQKKKEEAGKCREEVASLESDIRIVDSQIENCRKQIEKLGEKLKGRDSSALERERDRLREEFTRLKNSIDAWNRQVEEVEKNIEKVKSSVAELKTREAALRGQLENNKVTLKELKQEMSMLDAKIENEKKKYDELKDALGLQNVEEKIREVRALDRELEKLGEERKRLNLLLEKLVQQQSVIQNEINELRILKSRKEEIKEQKKQLIGQKGKELKELSGGRDPGAHLADVCREIEKIHRKWECLDKIYKEESEQKQNLQSRLAAAAKSKSDLECQLEADRKELAKMLDDNGFANREEVIKSYRKKRDIEALENEIREYTDAVKIVRDHIRTIESKLGGERVEEDEWEKLQKRRETLKESLQQKSDEIVRKEAAKAEVEKKLRELRELKKKKEKLEKECRIIDELIDLFKGKKFVEFIAKRQLKYIAREASRRLKEITRGRYALELDSEGNFVMRDDFNGGARRPTHTLSGGETFLTSLSLALALSSHIQLGRASLEFFFLDEGFGTLDAELLDTVINSLEQLRSDRLVVGVISHVDELKQRIPRKILVRPPVPGERGSVVELDES